MAQYELNVHSRTQTGKGAARQLRMKKQLPAILYGHKQDPIMFSMDQKEFTDLVHKHGSNSLLILTGDGGGETAFIKSMQKHYLKNEIQTVDFIRVSRNEQITVRVPVILVGEPADVTTGEGILVQALHELELTTTPANVPDSISVDVSHLELSGAAMTVADISDLPANIELVTPGDEAVAAVNLPAAEEEEEPATEELEGEEDEAGDVNATEEQSGQGDSSDSNDRGSSSNDQT